MSKPLWTILFIGLALATLWRAVPTVIKLWHYTRLEGEIPAYNVSFEVIPKKAKYALEGSYNYEYSGKAYQAKTLLAPPYHLNRPSAKEEIEKMQGLEWTAWVDPAHPEVSSLEKKFPWRDSFYTVCLLGLLIYFLYLRIHLQLLSRSM